MNTKNWPLLNLFLAVALLLAACNRATSEASTTPVPTDTPRAATRPPVQVLPEETPTPTQATLSGTVRIWHSWSESEQAALVQIRSAFNNAHPDVLFDVLYIPEEDLLMHYERETLEGNGPTLLLGPSEWGPPLYDAGLINDMSEIADADLLARLNAPALEAANYHGMLVGLPYAVYGVVLYRNKDIMTINADTFEELVTLAQASTQGETIGAVLERSFLYAGGHLQGIGGQMMDANGYPSFNTPEGLAWLQLLTDLEQAGPANYQDNQDLDAFEAGRVGWIIDGTWNLPAIAEAIGEDKLAIDPWPSYEAGRLSGFVMAENLYLSNRAESPHLEATWEFAQYLLSPEAQGRLADAGMIPATNDVTFVSVPSQTPLVVQAMVALAGGSTYPILPAIELYDLHLSIAIQAYLEGGVPAAQALQEAENAILQDLSAQEIAPTPTP